MALDRGEHRACIEARMCHNGLTAQKEDISSKNTVGVGQGEDSQSMPFIPRLTFRPTST